jgi:hypothetical protein
MNGSHRVLLIVTLAFLLVGLSAHLFPAASLCECLSQSQEDARATNLDLCLICQLQTGIHSAPCPTDPNHEIIQQVNIRINLHSLERAFPILRPPIA